MENYTLIDTHCDTITKLLDNNKKLYENDCSIDIKRGKNYKNYAQFFAIFTEEKYFSNPNKRVDDAISFFYNEIEENSNYIEFCKNTTDMKNAFSNNKIAAFLSIEGADAIKNEEMFQKYYNDGVRMISPTWNNDNIIAGGIGNNDKGLTEFGKRIITLMNDKKIILDLSHSSEQTFYECFDIYSKLIICSHSNSKVICNNNRNITDDQFKMIMKSNGVCSITFYPPFIRKKGAVTPDEITKHILHFLELGGEDNISIGSDFDGMSIFPQGIYGIESTYKLFDNLRQTGVNDEIINKIAYKNMERIISICL